MRRRHWRKWRGRAAQEVNSVEAIKGAVAVGLGAAFVSAAAVTKEVAAGSLAALRIAGLPTRRAPRPACRRGARRAG